MIITREKGMRMWGGGSGSTSASGVNGGGGFSLAVTEGEGTGNAYTGFTYESGVLSLIKGEKFVTVDFFNRLFTAYDSDGNAILPNDVTSTINNLKLLVGTWTEEYLSALGKNSEGGGGGGGIELSDVWQSLKTNTDDYANQKINSAHIPDLSGTYATKTWVNQQGFVTSSGVTSVAMTVPTGLSVSGSPITSTGTLALTFATGYSIPTTAKQSNWDTAYGWGNHATAGYASASSVTTLQGYFTDGVAKTAAKLNTGTTKYTAWGQTYWSSGVPQSVSGNMTSVGSITPSANGNALGTTSARFAIYGTSGNFSGNVSITGTLGVTGATTLTGLLTANGNIATGTDNGAYIQIGAIKLVYDSTNNALKVIKSDNTSANLYATGAVSALGSNSSGGGGSTFDEEQMWAALQGNTGTYANAKINVNHIPDISSTYGYAKASQLGSYLPLSGGTMTGTVWRKMTTDSSNYEVSVGWVNTSGSAIAEIGYINVAQKIVINPTKATSPWTDAVGKYVLNVGNNLLTYNTYNILHANNYSDYALPLTGGTLYKSTTDAPLHIKTHNTAGAYIGYQKNDGTTMGFIGVHPTYGAAYVSSGSTYPILRSDNYSSYALPLSGGTLTGGLTVNNSVTALGYNAKFDVDTSREMGYNWLNTSDTKVASVTYHNTSQNIIINPIGSSDTWSDAVGKYSLFIGNNKLTYNTYTILHSNNTYVSSGKGYINGTELTTISGNATTATTLQTPRTMWGQSFNGSANVSGDMSSVGNISFSASGKNIGGLLYFDTTNSRIGVGTSSPSYKLHVEGTGYVSTTFTAANIELGNINEINSTYSNHNLHLNYRVAGNVSICKGGGNCGIGTYSPSYKLHVDGTFYASGNASVGGNFTAAGEVTASSDARKKSIISDTKFNVRDIASARSVLYEWNDDRDKYNAKKIHGGSIAQDWLGKADSFLNQDSDGWYSINYGALALCSAITIAREVVKHDDEITRLKKEVVKLRERVAELEERRA